MYIRLKAYFISFVIHTLFIIAFFIIRFPAHKIVEVDISSIYIQTQKKELIEDKTLKKTQGKVNEQQKVTRLKGEVKKHIEKSAVEPFLEKTVTKAKEGTLKVQDREANSENIREASPASPTTPMEKEGQAKEPVLKAIPEIQKKANSENIREASPASPTTPMEKEGQAKEPVLKAIPEIQKKLEEEFLRSNLEVISGIIKQNMNYPMLARRLGMQGKVVISFLLTKDGYIRYIKVEESSGYKILDDNAINTVKKIEKLIPKPLVDVKIRLPIIYKLE
jgi:protein TonB